MVATDPCCHGQCGRTGPDREVCAERFGPGSLTMAVRFMQGMSMVELFLRLIINAALLMFVSRLVPGLYVEGWGAAFVGAIVLGLVNFFVKPVMVVLTFLYHTDVWAFSVGHQCSHAVVGVGGRARNPPAGIRLGLHREPALFSIEYGNLRHCETLRVTPDLIAKPRIYIAGYQTGTSESVNASRRISLQAMWPLLFEPCLSG